MDLSWQPVTGAAQRRRGRRLRAARRHEQQSIEQALATFRHHSSRGQRTARAGEWGSELNYTATIRRTSTPQAAGTQYLVIDVDEVPAAGGSKPDRLAPVCTTAHSARRRPGQRLRTTLHGDRRQAQPFEEEPGGSRPPCLGEQPHHTTHHHHHQVRTSCVAFCVSFVGQTHAGGLRSWLTHEQEPIAAVLATVTHHSFDKVGTANGVLWNQKRATRTGKRRGVRDAPRLRSGRLLPQLGSGRQLFVEVRPQGRPQQHTVEHIVDVSPFVQILDVPVPQMGGPTVGSREDARHCDPQGKCLLSCLRPSSCSSPSRSLTFQFLEMFLLEIEVFKVFTQNRVQQHRSLSSRTFTFQFPVEVFKVFAQDKVQLHHPHHLALQLAQKKCEGHRAVECAAGRALELNHAERSSNGPWSSW